MKTFLRPLIQMLLYWEASIFRNRYSGPVIAITGSVGKTSAKEAIATVVRKKYGEDCLVTAKSLNTEIGVPLTLLGYKDEPSGIISWLLLPIKGMVVALFGKVPKCMVLELGADHPGDIAYLARLVRPTHAVITAITDVHSQLFGSLEAITKEKTSLLQFLQPQGIAILNGDTPELATVKLAPGQTKILVRLHKRSDYFVTGVKVTLDGTEGVLHHGNRTQRLQINRFGEHQLYNVLFAAAVADSLEINPTQQAAAFKEIKPIPGRGMLIKGKRESYILDESYNASPEAMKQALHVLHQIPAKKRIAILGDMRELKSPDEPHREIGKLAHEVADYVIAVGPLSKAYKANEWFQTAREAFPSALRQAQPGVIILVKGSQNTIRLERVVKELMAHPEQAPSLLVRQGPIWDKRP